MIYEVRLSESVKIDLVRLVDVLAAYGHYDDK